MMNYWKRAYLHPQIRMRQVKPRQRCWSSHTRRASSCRWSSCAAIMFMDRINTLRVRHQCRQDTPGCFTNLVTEIIPKFTCLLERGQPVSLHGDGSPTRRYLYAGDAADAFDTILHKGQYGQIYNIGSTDELSNLQLCGMILTTMGIKHESREDFRKWVKFSHDRPFNDRRYAVDATKLKKLGWDQKTSFEDGLKLTINWYKQFGETWWGDISHVLTPFPTISEGEVVPDLEHIIRSHPPTRRPSQEHLARTPNGHERHMAPR